MIDHQGLQQSGVGGVEADVFPHAVLFAEDIGAEALGKFLERCLNQKQRRLQAVGRLDAIQHTAEFNADLETADVLALQVFDRRDAEDGRATASDGKALLGDLLPVHGHHHGAEGREVIAKLGGVLQPQERGGRGHMKLCLIHPVLLLLNRKHHLGFGQQSFPILRGEELLNVGQICDHLRPCQRAALRSSQIELDDRLHQLELALLDRSGEAAEESVGCNRQEGDHYHHRANQKRGGISTKLHHGFLGEVKVKAKVAAQL